MNLPIGGYIPTSFLDYPGHAAAVVFFRGCPFRCPFCHNPELILPGNGGTDLSAGEILRDLERRRPFLDGVCVTGGEPSASEGLLGFLESVRSLDLLVKLDTNGWRPEILSEALGRGIVNYLAMDVKAPWEKYSLASGWKGDLSRLRESVSILLESPAPSEFRTTLVPGIHESSDAPLLGSMVRGARLHVLQNFRPGITLDPRLASGKPFPSPFLEAFRKDLLPFVRNVEIRQ